MVVFEIVGETDNEMVVSFEVVGGVVGSKAVGNPIGDAVVVDVVVSGCFTVVQGYWQLGNLTMTNDSPGFFFKKQPGVVYFIHTTACRRHSTYMLGRLQHSR